MRSTIMRFSGKLLKIGSADPTNGSDNSVRLVQQKLKDKNYLITTVDGIFGTSTELAVKAFQRNNKLQIDGIVGKVTWDALINGYIASYHAYPGELIGYGSSGDNVKLIQEKLNNLGYDVGTIDGFYGNNTKQAIISFQSLHGLGADGIVGQRTWDVLLNGLTSAAGTTPRSYPGVFFMVGSNGENVVHIQNRLNEIGYNAGTADGFFGNTTHNAAVKFQSDHGLDADGVIGESSWNVLFNLNPGTYRPFAGVLLGVGSANNEVKLIQEKLNSLGYNVGTADGIFGTGTESAVKSYQQSKNLDADGIVGKLTWDTLFNGVSRGDTEDNTIQYPGYLIGLGNADSNVTLIQKRLNMLNMGTLIEDGIFGAATKNAVIAFQNQNSLDADGVVGQSTWAKLFRGARMGGYIAGPVSSGNTYSGTLLSVGSAGSAVVKLQNKLYEIGYTSVGSSDGIFGENTRNAVIAFQHDRGLVEDGIVGNNTWNAIFGTQEVSTVDPNVQIKRIFIDAGHGGSDPGAVGNGLNEKDINLKISLRQKALFEAAGYTVFMSRSGDNYVNLKDRTTQANALGVDLLISNHVNAGGGKGSEVWCSIYGGAGRVIADRVCNNLSNIFYNRGVKTRQGENGDYLHMIRESRMPAILIEHGFIDNIDDANRLRSNAYIDQMAQATVNAVKNVYTPNGTEDNNIIKVIPTGIAAGFDRPHKNISLINPNIPLVRVDYPYGYVQIAATLVTNEDVADIELDENNTPLDYIKDIIKSNIEAQILGGTQAIDSINKFLDDRFGIKYINFTGIGDIMEMDYDASTNIFEMKVIGIEFISDIPGTTYKLKEEVSLHIRINFDDLARQFQEAIQSVSDIQWVLVSVVAIAAVCYIAYTLGIPAAISALISNLYPIFNGLKSAGFAL